jgi:Aspartyl/Asparaginyl beta-hydroxylase
MRCLQLPFRFDPARLTGDLRRVEPSEWIPHFNVSVYQGQWSGAALRSIAGEAGNLLPEAIDASRFQDTALLGRCHYFREVLSVFECPLQAARLLRLSANAHIAEHVDNQLEFEEGLVRLHVPIVTDEEVWFYLDGARLVMSPGECWYTNVNLPHAVDNRSAVDRVHLVIDCQVNAWLRGVFEAAPRPPCDHYEARISLPAPPAVSAVVGLFVRWANENQATFRAEKNTLVLSWAAEHTWQLRVRLLDAQPVDWAASLESSPDPDRQHQRHYDALLGAMARELPSAVIEH